MALKSTAQDKVLTTPEILEAIFLQLPLTDVLVNAQRINHAWKTLINSSPLLQRALFFQPELLPGIEPRINPLLQQLFPIFFDVPGIGEDNAQYQKMRWAEDFAALDWNSSNCKQKAYSRATASWRQMLPVQPPIRTLELIKVTHAQIGDGQCSGEKVFEDGVRMGTLWDLVEDGVKKPITKFGIKWVGERRAGVVVDLLGWTNETDGRVFVTLAWTMQCCCDMDNSLGEEFRSDGYEEVKIDVGKEKWSRH